MSTMLYNGVEFPDIETVWTDKEPYPYAILYVPQASYDSDKGTGYLIQMLQLRSTQTAWDSDNSKTVLPGGNNKTYWRVYQYSETDGGAWLEDGAWSLVSEGSETATNTENVPLWANYDILDSATGSVHMFAKEPVNPDDVTYISWDMKYMADDALDSVVADGMTAYKVADVVPTVDDLIGAFCYIACGITCGHEMLSADICQDLGDGGIVFMSEGSLVIGFVSPSAGYVLDMGETDDAGNPVTVTLPSAGIFVVDIWAAYSSFMSLGFGTQSIAFNSQLDSAGTPVAPGISIVGTTFDEDSVSCKVRARGLPKYNAEDSTTVYSIMTKLDGEILDIIQVTSTSSTATFKAERLGYGTSHIAEFTLFDSYGVVAADTLTVPFAINGLEYNSYMLGFCAGQRLKKMRRGEASDDIVFAIPMGKRLLLLGGYDITQTGDTLEVK